MNYGLPYMGSKSLLADWIISRLPRANGHLYDLMAGGCAISHRAMLSGKWQKITANDITDTPKLFIDAVHGRYHNESRWVSREDFNRLKDTDPYIRTCWSFGNNVEKGYLYSREIEPWKYALHAIRLWHDPEPMRKFGINTDGSTRDIKRHHDEYRKAYAKWYIAEVLKSEDEYEVMRQKLQERIDKESDELRQYLLRALNASGLKQSEVGQRLGTQMQGYYFGRSQWAFPTKEYYEQMQTFMPLLDIPYDKIETLAQLKVDIDTLSQADSVQKPKRLWECDSEERNNRLRSLESLGSLDRLNVLHGDYASVVPESGSVIYLDPPYRGTSEYNGIVFNHERFYEWIERQTERGCFVFISEYDMPSNRFSIIAETSHRSRLSASANMAVTERLFVPIHQEYKNEQAQLRLF